MSFHNKLIVVIGALVLTACATAQKSKPASSLEIDETELRARLTEAGISLDTLKEQIHAEIEYQRAVGALPKKSAPETN